MPHVHQGLFMDIKVNCISQKKSVKHVRACGKELEDEDIILPVSLQGNVSFFQC